MGCPRARTPLRPSLVLRSRTRARWRPLYITTSCIAQYVGVAGRPADTDPCSDIECPVLHSTGSLLRPSMPECADTQIMTSPSYLRNYYRSQTNATGGLRASTWLLRHACRASRAAAGASRGASCPAACRRRQSGTTCAAVPWSGRGTCGFGSPGCTPGTLRARGWAR